MHVETTFARKDGRGELCTVVAVSGRRGVRTMGKFESTPGPAQTAPDRWPRDSRLVRAEGQTTLLLFLHPRCSCSEATLTELEKLVALNHTGFAILAVFAIPPNGGMEWKESPIIRRASSIRGTSIVFDPGGIEARRFGAITSGSVGAYGREGELRFAGGITQARGVEGEGAAWLNLRKVIDGSSATRRTLDPFGCPLRKESSYS